MSWEETGITKVTCPCGKGIISQKHYGDDWNRFKDGEVVIECEDCKKRYRIESEYHESYHPGHGDWTIYYLTPIEYPSYTGIRENDIYGALHNNIYEVSFVDYLIERYSLCDLTTALTEYIEKRSSSKVSGIAAQIRKEFKHFFNSVKAASIIEKLEEAIKRYSTYQGSYEQRMIVRNQENKERAEYMREKQKHQIRLEL